MDAATLTNLQDFVEAANQSGQLNYEYGCEITAVEEDHVVVRFFDEDGDGCCTGKLSVHSDTLMAWQEEDDAEPILFSNRPWVLVAITYAGA